MSPLLLLLPASGLALYVISRIIRREGYGESKSDKTSDTKEREAIKSRHATPYITPLSDIVVPTFVKVGDVEMTVEPLRDRRGGYARLTYKGATEAAEGSASTLPTPANLIAFSDAARTARSELTPVTLPDAAMLRSAAIDPKDQALVNAFRSSQMGGEAWAQEHDKKVEAQKKAIQWNGASPLSNAGKHWVGGAKSGRALLMGWRTKDGWIQPAPPMDSNGPHNDLHHDYGTTTLLVRRK